MNNEIVNAILQNYKDKNRSAHELIRDPLFRSMTPEQQIEVISGYAGVLAQDGKAPEAGKIFLKSVGKGVLAGAFASLPAALTSDTGPGRSSIMGIGAILGGVIGAGSGIMTALSDKKRFEETNKYLVQLNKKKNLQTAVKVLDEERTYTPKTLANLLPFGVVGEKDLYDRGIGLSTTHVSKSPNFLNIEKEWKARK